jgi:hypothetical protein
MALSAKWLEPTNWIEVPFNLRPDFVAYVQVPKDLTRAEAERLSEMVLALGLPNAILSEGGEKNGN